MRWPEKIAIAFFVFFFLFVGLLLRTDPDWYRPEVIFEYDAIITFIIWIILRVIFIAAQAVGLGR